MSDFDLVIRAATVVGGSGSEPYVADVAVKDDTIAAVDAAPGRGDEEIEGAGLHLTPGFVDVHTHYDGQITWENRLNPSSNHGVTTVILGNCGVGFAPVYRGDRELAIRFMEGVEDIPEVVMREGVPWNWQSFPEYRDALEAPQADVDFAAQLPHSSLRVFVMGERGANLEPTTDADLAEMRRLVTEAVEAGALGISTSRNLFHRFRWGKYIEAVESIAKEGRPIHGQFMPHPIGLLFGLDLGYHPFSLNPSFRSIAHLPLAEKVKAMRDPELRAKLLSEEPDDPNPAFVNLVKLIHGLYLVHNPARYNFRAQDGLTAKAERLGKDLREAIYDALLEDDGHAVLSSYGSPVPEYLAQTAEFIGEVDFIPALGDGGALYGMICDAGYTTYMLVERLGRDSDLPTLVKSLSSLPAQSVGLNDRGFVAPGYKADLNLIDLDSVELYQPSPVADLPAGGKRLAQCSDGYVATLMSRIVTYRHGEPTGALSGRLVRGARDTRLDAAA